MLITANDFFLLVLQLFNIIGKSELRFAPREWSVHHSTSRASFAVFRRLGFYLGSNMNRHQVYIPDMSWQTK